MTVHRAGAMLAALLSLVIAAAPAASCAADTAATSADLDRLIAFVGGSPPDSTERAAIATEIAARFSSDPAGSETFDRKLNVLLGKIANADAPDQAAEKARLRLFFALLRPDDPARRAVEARDPTLFFDRADKTIVTEATLVAWQRACAWVAGVYGLPGPGAGFGGTLHTLMRDRFPSLYATEKDAVADVATTYALARHSVAHDDKAWPGLVQTPMHAGPNFPVDVADVLGHGAALAMHQASFSHQMIMNNFMLNNMMTMQTFTNPMYQNMVPRPPVTQPLVQP